MSNTDSKVTPERLREALDYDSETGLFTWRIHCGPAKPGKPANPLDVTTGYIRISLDGRNYQAHRLAWLHHYGVWPSHEIDHINGDRADNRIANLRDVPRPTNMANKRAGRGRSQYIGVNWHEAMGRFEACITRDGRRHRLGFFEIEEEAAIAYLQAKIRLDHSPTTNP